MKQILAIAVVLKRTGFTYQPVDDMSIVHIMLASATQPRKLLDTFLGIPDFHMVCVDTNFYLLTKQAAVDGVRVA